MRYPASHKLATRTKLVDAAATLLRREGFEGVSIPGLMKQLGLTHGGFYRHFSGRDALLAEAATTAARQTADGVFASQPDLAHTLDRYLSPEHVAHPEAGCVLAATGTDGPRQPKKVRRALGAIAQGFLSLLEVKLHPKDAQPTRPNDDTLRLAAQMIGAVVLARLVDEPRLAARILKATKTP